MSDTVDANPEMRTASQMLSEARIALGLSQEEVAQELFLIPSYIRHIDNDEIDKIDKQAFVRGYLRSYAKLVNLDGDDMVSRFEKTQGAQPQKIEIRAVTQEPVGSTNFTGPVIQTAVMGLIGFVVVVSLVWFLVSSGDDEPEVAESSAAVATEVAESDPVENTDSALAETDITATSEMTVDSSTAEATDLNASIEASSEEMADNVAEAVAATEDVVESGANEIAADVEESVADAESELEAEVSAAVDTASEALSETVAESVASSDAIEQVEDALAGKQISIQRADGVIRVDAGGSDELSFTFSDECWVEIEDSEGHAIYGDLNRAGDQLVVSGTGPFEVLFGKAPAVTMLFNGEPYDLAPHTTSVDTAKVKVGN